jgi:UDP-2,3-diacylglucosamine pyrophosphatase LpxH
LGILDFLKRDHKRYQDRIDEGLTKAYGATDFQSEALDLDEGAPLVFVSDLHKGTRDRSDDFWICERAYRTCLGYYLAAGYRLFVLGDVEELWECWPGDVIEKYKDTLQLEAKFHAAGRYERLWGNHDDHWNKEGPVQEHLHEFYPGLVVHEALKFHVKSQGEDIGTLFLVHGHQGTAASDHNSGFSRFVVRYLWRPFQRVTGISRNTPAKDHRLRRSHNEAMFNWARKHPDPVVMMAGHTHKPVFWQSWHRSERELEEELRNLDPDDPEDAERIPGVRAALELAKAEEHWRDAPPLPISPPCYFNTGCCAFSDGDVTAIEIKNGKISLVRWLNDEEQPVRKPLSLEEDVSVVFARVRNKHTAPGVTEYGRGRLP